MKKLRPLTLACMSFAFIGANFAVAAHHEQGNAPQADHSRTSGTDTVTHRSDQKSKDDIQTLIAVMLPTDKNSASGTVLFEAAGGNKVNITASFTGLNPNSSHAIHIHEYGDTRADDGTSAGGHYNPEGHPHALPDENQRHAGDLGNLSADSDGEAEFTITVDNITLNGSKNPIIGRAVIVHAKEDDGGQPTGNAGGRISQGVIGVVNPEYSDSE